MSETCQVCLMPYEEVWSTSDEIWEKITEAGEQEPSINLMCMGCFSEWAAEKGIVLCWECAVGAYPSNVDP